MRTRGLCSVCYRKYEVFSTGNVRNHWVPYELRDTNKGKFCAGSGQPPHGSHELLVKELKEAPPQNREELIRADERRRILAWLSQQVEGMRYNYEGSDDQGSDFGGGLYIVQWATEYFGLVDTNPGWLDGYAKDFPKEENHEG